MFFMKDMEINLTRQKDLYIKIKYTSVIIILT